MIENEVLKRVLLSNDVEFMTYVKWLRHTEINDTILHSINERMNKLGYTFEIGCCGKNNIRKIEK